jgi:hypothetical protein
MAQQRPLCWLLREASRRCAVGVGYSRLVGVILMCAMHLIGAAVGRPQSSQQHVYGSTTSELSSFSKNANGSLTALSTVPFGNPQFQSGPMAIDGLGKYVFALDPASGGIWMFSIQGDGTLIAAPGAPYFAPNNGGATPPAAVSLATEHSGQFVFVGYPNAGAGNSGLIVTFTIDAEDPENPQLVAVPATASSIVGASPTVMVASPSGNTLYVALSGSELSGAGVYTVGADGGLTELVNGGTANARERSIAIDPLGRFFFDGWGANEGFVESGQISPIDGTITPGAALGLGLKNFPEAMLVDNTGKFLYVSVPGDQGTMVYSINAAGGLTQSAVSPLTGFGFQTGTAVADPQGPYLYVAGPDGIHGFLVDPVLGDVAALAVAPFSGTSVGVGGLAISGAQVQAVTGAVAELFPLSQDFGMITVGQVSGAKIASVSDVGSLPVTLSNVSLSGANMGDFTITPNCSLPAILLSQTSNASCSISVTFAPTGGGPRQATLTATDSAGTQSAQLTGIGIAAASEVTLVPGSLTFSNTSQGSVTAAQPVTLTSSGAATLHISSVQLGGSNAGDFAVSNGCGSGAYAANASCSIGVTFSPLGDGPRSAMVLIADDAPGSPQTISLSGSGTGAPVVNPVSAAGATVAPPALIFPATAPGATSAQQNITITSSGSSALHFSAAPQLSGVNAADFTVGSNGCTAAAYPAKTACVIGLTFTPSGNGTRTAILTIRDDAADAPQTIAISGTSSTALSVTVGAGGSLSATVAAGGTALYSLQLTPGFNGSVSFSCSGAPTGATCAVPGPLKVTSGATATFLVTVSTTANTAVAASTGDVGRREFRATGIWMIFTAWWWLGCARLAFYGAARFALRAASGEILKERMPRLAAMTAITMLAVSAGVCTGGCGGGGSVAQNAPATQSLGTPPGTSTISVTLTATTAGGAAVTGIAPILLSLTVN